MSAPISDVGVWRKCDFEVCMECKLPAHPGEPCKPKEPKR